MATHENDVRVGRLGNEREGRSGSVYVSEQKH